MLLLARLLENLDSRLTIDRLQRLLVYSRSLIAPACRIDISAVKDRL